MRSALAAKQIWVAVITIRGTLDSLPLPVLGRYVLALQVGKVLGKLKFWMVWLEGMKKNQSLFTNLSLWGQVGGGGGWFNLSEMYCKLFKCFMLSGLGGRKFWDWMFRNVHLVFILRRRCYIFMQCLCSARFWLSGSRTAKICRSTDPDPRGKISTKNCRKTFYS